MSDVCKGSGGGAGGRRCLPLLLLVAMGLGGCSLLTTGDERPTTARVRIEGTAPQPMEVIRSTNFFEQLNLDTGDRRAILVSADTVEISLPFDETVPVGIDGSVYVELLYRGLDPANIRMRVDLRPGDESFDRSATMSDNAQLIYYFIFDQN